MGWARGGKSELRRAGWSVIRTVPESGPTEFGGKESATEKIPPTEALALVGKGEKVR